MSFPLVRRGLVLVATVLAAGCADDGTTPQPVTVTLSSVSVTVEEESTAQLTATVSGSPGAAVTWSSSDESVATVGPTGLVTGVAPGTATVTGAVSGEGASASATVTVTAIPLAVSFDGFVIDGQPVPADALMHGVAARVTFDAPASFQGAIEVRSGDLVLGRVEVGQGGGGAAGPGSAHSGPLAAVGREREIDVPLALAVIDGDALRTPVLNDAESSVQAFLQRVGGESVSSPPMSVRGDLEPLVIVNGVTYSKGPVAGPGGTSFGGGTVTMDALATTFTENQPPIEEIKRIEVLDGPTAIALYGPRGANGAIIIEMKDDILPEQGGGMGLEGRLVFGATAELLLEDGTPLSALVANASETFPGLSTGFYLDNLGPRATYEIQPSAPVSLGAKSLKEQWSATLDAGWVDAGVDLVTESWEFGPSEAYEYGERTSLEGLPESAGGIHIRWVLTDGLGNITRSVPVDAQGQPLRFGIDLTPPDAAVFNTGLGFTLPGAVNPPTLRFAWTASDPAPGSGIDALGYRMSLEYARPTVNQCLIGLGSDCDPDQAAPGAENGWTPDVPGGSAEFRLGVRATDLATNTGPLRYLDWLVDEDAPGVNGTLGLGVPTNGTVPVTGVEFTDDLEMFGVLAVSQFSIAGQGPIPPMYSGYLDVGTPFDGTFLTTSSQAVDMEWIRSLETTEPTDPQRPTGMIHPLEVVYVVGLDHAGNSAVAFNANPGVTPRGASFLTAGMDHFAFRTMPGMICDPIPSGGANCNGAPTSVDVVVEAFTSGAEFEILEVILLGTQLDGGNPIPLSTWMPLTVMDQGGFREGTATFTLEGAALGLTEGSLYLRAVGRDADGGAILSQELRYETIH